MHNDDPFYIADVSHCAKQYMKWKQYLPRVKPFYAIKTNPNDFIIKVIGKMGGGFDCASIEELNAVLSVYPDIDCSQQVIYAHPCKQISHLIYFKNRGVRLTVADNTDELIKIKRYWPNAKVLIRLKTNDTHSLIALSTKFGVHERIAIRMFDLAKKLDIYLVGCTFHVGTGCYNTTAFLSSIKFAKILFDIAKTAEYNFKFTILDIGGGFPGVAEESKPNFSEMAQVINQTLDEMFPEIEGTQIIAEPGRYFAAACMNLVTSIIGVRSNNRDYTDILPLAENGVLDINSIENVERYYYVNDGILGSFANILYEKAVFSVSCLRKKTMTLPDPNETLYNSAVFGPTCDSSDQLSPSVHLPLMEIGDYLWFDNIGAYSNSASTNFNGFNTKKYFYIWKD
ncbi:unnamed protein product [Rotaria socialis]|uniref:Orn/DAP/Arg decarboxylase 2 N-terminal domain-containing protein n=1 Tax=Rotaria socialis TaxID=392032 RepID=A0A821DLJ0_9BILA|nr:unnamed protein product [Rotaria socialis]CAF4623342.1 unnamed protein product [Rotaria socialis]